MEAEHLTLSDYEMLKREAARPFHTTRRRQDAPIRLGLNQNYDIVF